ncbi:MAG: heavy-metal-associated domain-containing protein [Bacteroidales bacterium]|nr:heavy-metal-associated domain-containing protein [Bacteroidales bacterium]
MTLAACKANTGPNEPINRSIDSTKLASYAMHVEGMTCNGCENTIKEKISENHGVANVSASFQDSLVNVSLDTSLTQISEIEKTISDIGYTVHGNRLQ